MRHRVSQRVRFGHSDPAGIAYYPRFFEWFHDIFEGMFEPVMGRPYADVLRDTRVGFPAVSLSCSFDSPARFGDVVDVEVFLSRISERSMTFEYRVLRDGASVAKATVKVAAMDMDKHRGTTFPTAVRDAFLPYVEQI